MKRKQLAQHRSRSAPDVDDGSHAIPASDQLELSIRRSVPGNSHQRVEALGELTVGGEVLPERAAVQIAVAGLPGERVGQQGGPDLGHPPTDAGQIEKIRLVAQLPGELGH